MEDILSKKNDKYENTVIDTNSKYDHLPTQSLRVNGELHTRINALKKVRSYESINEVLDVIMRRYITTLSTEEREEYYQLVETDNMIKLRNSKKRRRR